MVVDLGQALFLSYVLMQFVEALLKPAIKIVNAKLRKEEIKDMLLELWPLYLTVAVAGGIAWFANLNLLPILGVIGKTLTAIGIGLGPSFLYDTFVDVYEDEEALSEQD